MSTIQVPKAITKVVALQINDYVMSNYPNIMMIEDCNLELQVKWEKACDHELFYQDVNRYIGDVYALVTHNLGV